MPELQDSAARAAAVDPSRSLVVQAPAGSGKTELLTLRYLALLTTVSEPEEILAITFAKAATAEMRERILGALEAARTGTPMRPELAELAQAALLHAERSGWRLLEQPQRLNIHTIDSLALRIAQKAPLLSRLGGRLSPTEASGPLYRRAARHTLELLASADTEISDAITHLLQLRNTSLADCEDLIAEMLAKRDQWMDLFPLGKADEAEWKTVRARLEAPLQAEHDRVIGEARGLLAHEPHTVQELLGLARYACGNDRKKDISLLRDVHTLEQMAHAEHWRCLCHLLLTNENSWLKRIDATIGFPSDGREHKQRLLEVIRQLSTRTEVLDALRAIRALPPNRYAEEEWLLVRRILTILLRAVAELRIVFAEEVKVDFPEVGLAARAALTGSDDELAFWRSENTRHILVDEFQDTSRPQYDLITRLLGEWRPGDGRTCFLVGDPMQSIYLFRQAEVELFAEAQKHGLACDAGRFPLQTVTLEANFRSTPGVVRALNGLFGAVFQSSSALHSQAIPFVPSVSALEEADGEPFHVEPDFLTQRNALPPREARIAARRREARRVIHTIRRHQPAIEAAQREGREYTIAVLVRARTHLPFIADELRKQAIPYHAVEIETSRERQEVLDLISLLRALMHPMDRIAWLSVLRAPWCGLGLADIHALCGDEEGRRPLLTLLDERLDRLDDEGRRRAGRVLAVLRAAIEQRGKGALGASPNGLATWLEQTWEALGGPACLTSEAQTNARAFFNMLAQLPPSGLAPAGDDLDTALDRLFAHPDPNTSNRCGVQLMTIYKAKGLGFDVVIVPALEKIPPHTRPLLLSWLARKSAHGAGQEILLAPIGKTGVKGVSLSRWIEDQRAAQLRDEQRRLLYVACSRARRELHLLGVAEETPTSSLKRPRSTSLLRTAWPALEAIYTNKWQAMRLEQAAAQSSGNGNLLHFPPNSSHEEAGPAVVPSIAATAAATGPTPQRLRRLSTDWSWRPAAPSLPLTVAVHVSRAEPPADTPFRREGSRESRIRGVVIHALLEQLSRSAAQGSKALDPADPRWKSIAVALVRQHGLTSAAERELIAAAMDAITRTLADRVGRWILEAHAAAQSESAWTTALGGEAETLRPDRIFLAGPEPLAPGEDVLWIVDYKTAAAPPPRKVEAFLAEERQRHREQLAEYSRVLRHAFPALAEHRVGLYYPLLPRLDWRPDWRSGWGLEQQQQLFP